MVGIPGKSSGCATCRRRKVKCDLARPHCQRCTKAKLECGGYERFPVFINRTARGLIRRTRLEETRPEASRSADVKTEDEATDEEVTARIDAENAQEDETPAPTILTLSSPAAQAVPFKAWFHNAFVRRVPSWNALQERKSWLAQVIELPSPTPVLSSSLLALSAFHWARVHQSRDMEQEARTTYARSMSAVRRALTSNDVLQSDDVLASCYMMTLFELFDVSSWHTGGWMQHLAGVISMIRFRGSKYQQSDLSLAIFEHVRYIMMVAQLERKKKGVLSDEEWISNPWVDREKCSEQQVFDCGLRLATLLDRSSTVSGESRDRGSPDIMTGLGKVATDLDRLMQILPQDFSAPTSTDLEYGPEPLATSMTPQRLLRLTGMGIRLTALQTAADLAKIVVTETMVVSHVQDLDSKQAYLEALLPEYRSEAAIQLRKELAQSIVMTAFICHGVDMSSLGCARVLWAVRAAKREFAVADFWHQRAVFVMDRLKTMRSLCTKILLTQLPLAVPFVIPDRTRDGIMSRYGLMLQEGMLVRNDELVAGRELIAFDENVFPPLMNCM